MALNDCANPPASVTGDMVTGTPWQDRLKRAGLTQRKLAALMAMPDNTISRQMKGEWSVPGYTEAVVAAWEIMTPEEREAWEERLRRERQKP